MAVDIGGCGTPHAHDFGEVNPLAEQRTRWVVIITAFTMVLELLVGWWSGSMALLADGWHMSSHVIALGLSVAAYVFARRLRLDDRFAFGTWKIEVLGGYTSALLLTGVVLLMTYECVTRLFHPVAIAYGQALAVAALGLLVNLVSAWLLAGTTHGPGHADLNLRSAYVHVAADAATSLLAVGALVGGRYFQLVWLDAGVGLLGSTVVAVWAWALLRSTGRILLDAEMDAPVVQRIREALREAPIAVEIHDLHVWRVGRGKYACILGIATDAPVTPEYFRTLLRAHDEIAHVTVEISRSAVAPP